MPLDISSSPAVSIFMKKVFLFFFTAALGFAACTNDKMESNTPVANCDTAGVTYTTVIRPLTNQHCAISGCHINGGANAGNIDLTTYQGLKAVADNGSLLGSLRGTPGYALMPLNAPKLDNCTIAKYAKWVADGAPEN